MVNSGFIIRLRSSIFNSKDFRYSRIWSRNVTTLLEDLKNDCRTNIYGGVNNERNNPITLIQLDLDVAKPANWQKCRRMRPH